MHHDQSDQFGRIPFVVGPAVLPPTAAAPEPGLRAVNAWVALDDRVPMALGARAFAIHGAGGSRRKQSSCGRDRLQLVARRPGEARPRVRHPAADRLAAMIFAAVQ